MKKIERAIISVSDKTGLIELAEELKKYAIEIYSTGGTLQKLVEAGIDARGIESYTKYPEMLDGRVKTLHPRIHGGILAKRDDERHMQSLSDHEISTFDLVIINLYPFEEVIRRDSFSFEDAIENIDIGGPSMVRSAAKNYNDVAVVIDPSQYDTLKNELKAGEGATSREFRFELMLEAFRRTASYDAVIARYLSGVQGTDFPESLSLPLKKVQSLRYGENPHQKAAFYQPAVAGDLSWQKLHGKELSYNNLLDLDAAIRLGSDFSRPVCAVFKHTNPCGVAAGGSPAENLERAIKTDPVSFFGGIAVFNEPVSPDAAAIINKYFFEIVVAPDFPEESFSKLKEKKNIRLVKVPGMNTLVENPLEIRSVASGFLVQETDREIPEIANLKTVTQKKPTDEELNELLFAFQMSKFVKSNAVVFTRDSMTLGIGAGQMSRVDSIRFAIAKAEQAELSLEGSYLGSDAFFPFRDSVDMAVAAGARGIIQPGGSIRDEESIKAADEAGIIMVTTGIRHFRH